MKAVRVPRRAGYVAETVWIAGYVVDFGFSAAAAFHLKDRLARLDEAWDELQEDIQDSIQNLRLYEAAVQASLYELGVYREEGESHTVEDILRMTGIRPRYGRWLARAVTNGDVVKNSHSGRYASCHWRVRT